MSSLFGGGNAQPNIVIPPAETPRAFQTIIPQKSYKDLAEAMGRTEGEINRVMDQRYDQATHRECQYLYQQTPLVRLHQQSEGRLLASPLLA